MKTIARLLVVLSMAVLLPTPACALPGEDAYIEGFAAALLEREFRITAPSLRVQNGVIIIGAGDLAGTDRARVVSALSRIRGAVRVDVVESGAVSFGETITGYRTRLGPGYWEAGVQAGVFAVFDLAAQSKDLINADYFV